MLNFLKKLFTKNSKTSASSMPPKQAAKKTTSNLGNTLKVAFKSDLTSKFKSDHQLLLGIYSAILTAAKDKKCTEVSKQLIEFKTLLKEHLAEEFRDLYLFIEYFADMHSADDREKIRRFRNEMNTIGIKVMGTINLYSRDELTEEVLPRFIQDFNALGEVLVDRIQREEADLYKIYDNYGMHYKAAA